MEAAVLTPSDITDIVKEAGVFGIAPPVVASLCGVPSDTVRLWRRGDAHPRSPQHAQLVQLRQIFALLRTLFAGPDFARKWLHKSRPERLGGVDTPFAVLQQGGGDRVGSLLQLLAYGG